MGVGVVDSQAGQSEVTPDPPVGVSYYFPNRMGRIVLTAMEDIMGFHGVNATLNLANLPHLVNNYPPNNLDRAFMFSDLSSIQEAVDDIFGASLVRRPDHHLRVLHPGPDDFADFCPS